MKPASLILRKSADRGGFDFGWLKTKHTFSFGEYQDPEWDRFGYLRVINEDWIAPAKGFGTHPHRDMEIVTYVISGELSHSDSTGGKGVIRAGEVQRMTAGSGLQHSEQNLSPTTVCHLLQIWMFPNQRGLAPSYGQKDFGSEIESGRATCIAGGNSGMPISQDAAIWVKRFGSPSLLDVKSLSEGRPQVWIHVVRGSIEVGGVNLVEGDGAGISNLSAEQINGSANSEVILFFMREKA